jgi:hypothetical protein
MTSVGQVCRGCGLTNNVTVELRRCGKCRNVWYCGDTCQRQDWGLRHRAECQPARKTPKPNSLDGERKDVLDGEHKDIKRGQTLIATSIAPVVSLPLAEDPYRRTLTFPEIGLELRATKNLGQDTKNLGQDAKNLGQDTKNLGQDTVEVTLHTMCERDAGDVVLHETTRVQGDMAGTANLLSKMPWSDAVFPRAETELQVSLDKHTRDECKRMEETLPHLDASSIVRLHVKVQRSAFQICCCTRTDISEWRTQNFFSLLIRACVCVCVCVCTRSTELLFTCVFRWKNFLLKKNVSFREIVPVCVCVCGSNRLA